VPERFWFEVPEKLDGGRLDHAVSQLMESHSRSAVGRLIDEGEITVDGRVALKRSETVRQGQRIEISIPPPENSEVIAQELPLQILYQDEAIAVIDKPAGLVVHPSAGHADKTLVNALLFHLHGLSAIGGVIRPGIVHRLDKETSGVMVIAKNDAAHRTLTEVWGSAAVEKEYLAVVYGTPRDESGTIDAPIGRHPSDRKKMGVVPTGRRAVTRYRLVRTAPHVSLLRCRLETGRTHQIRVHLKSIGHPIVGDPLYSGPQWRGIPDKRLQKILASFPRQALHASRLRLPHPVTGESMEFRAPLPEDLRTLLEELGLME
jgi:23S rRNA pseudouridine1911/1915/1917 synthase